MSDDEDIAALVVDNGAGMCKGVWMKLCDVDLKHNMLDEVLRACHVDVSYYGTWALALIAVSM
jgi:hypothetical protein